jgi:hypothetical protein
MRIFSENVIIFWVMKIIVTANRRSRILFHDAVIYFSILSLCMITGRKHYRSPQAPQSNTANIMSKDLLNLNSISV